MIGELSNKRVWCVKEMMRGDMGLIRGNRCPIRCRRDLMSCKVSDNGWILGKQQEGSGKGKVNRDWRHGISGLLGLVRCLMGQMKNKRV